MKSRRKPQGFRKYVQTNVALAVNASLTADISLQVG